MDNENHIDVDAESGAELWRAFAACFNADWLIDEMAQASRESHHAKLAYNLLRAASDATIETLESRLFLIDARAKG